MHRASEGTLALELYYRFQRFEEAVAHRLIEWRPDPFARISEQGSTMIAWQDVFEPTPTSWGLRGDPYAWFRLRARLGSEHLPEDPADDRAVLARAFHEVVGLHLDDRTLPRELYVQDFAFGGMSSGLVDLHHWRDRLVPLLLARAADVRGGVPAGAAALPTWPGVLAAPAAGATSNALADMAKAGDWEGVFGLLDGTAKVGPNSWRAGGTSMFTPLHHAAWHGAPVDVVERLIHRGAWRTLRSEDGRRPVDVAGQRGHAHLAAVLEPVTLRHVDSRVLVQLDVGLAALVETRIRPWLDVRLRHPQSEVLTEIPGGALWHPVPGMYGGFRVTLREDHLFVTSWRRVVAGSGQSHVITTAGAVLVSDGFD